MRCRTLFPLVLLAGPLACATGRQVTVPKATWPPPPSPARVSYRGEIRSERDVAGGGIWEGFLAAFGGRGKPEPLRSPIAVAFDPLGRLLVADAERRAVLVLDLEHAHSKTIAPAGAGALHLPVAVDADADGRIYVADGVDRAVRVFSADGEPLARLAAGGSLLRPSGLAIDRKRGLLYVADAPANVVHVLTLDGTPARVVGGPGVGPGELNHPTFVAVQGDGSLLVVDALNFRVQVFDSTGRATSAFGRHGDGSGDLSAPKGVAVDAAGRVFVADALFDNFQIFDREGHLLLFVGGHGHGAGEFSMPSGLAVRGTTVAVADRGGGRIELFELLPEPGAASGGSP